MRFSLAAITFLFAGALAAPKALQARSDGCPADAPNPMGSPGNYWYIVCCPWVLSDPGCCNREPSIPREVVSGKLYTACPTVPVASSTPTDPVVSLMARAPQAATSAPTAPAASTTAPVASNSPVASTAPVASTTAPVASTTAPVASTAAPVVSTVPVASTTAPVVSTAPTTPEASTAAPVVSTTPTVPVAATTPAAPVALTTPAASA